MKQAFVGAKILPIEGDPIENGTMIVENGSIIAIGNNIPVDDCDIIDCTGKTITPGFIDAHSHVGLWEEGAGPGPANSDGNEITAAIVPHLRSMDAIFPEDLGFEDARKGGVTTMGITHGSANPIGAQFCVVKSAGHIIDEMVIKQPAGIKFAMGENPKRVGFNNKRAPNTRMSVAHLIREAFYETIDYQAEWEEYNSTVKKEMKNKEEERKPIKKPKYNLKYEALSKLLNGEIPARTHSHRADDIRTAIRLSEEFGYRIVIDHATESYKIKEVIAEKNLPVVIGPLIGTRVKRELVDQKVSTPGIMMNAGVTVCITTDAPVIGINNLRDSVILAVREGLPVDRALETITINPAKVLELDNRVGSLKVGKDADFLIFNGDPLDARTKVEKTYINGNLVYHSD